MQQNEDEILENVVKITFLHGLVNEEWSRLLAKPHNFTNSAFVCWDSILLKLT